MLESTKALGYNLQLGYDRDTLMSTILGNSGIDSDSTIREYNARLYPRITSENIDVYIERFNVDCQNNNLDALSKYLFNDFFLMTLCNNSETTLTKFIIFTALDIKPSLKKKIFKTFFDAVTDSKRERILSNKSFEEFYSSYENLHHHFPEVNVIEDQNMKLRNDVSYLITTLVSEMMSCETPNPRYLDYYFDGFSSTFSPENGFDEYYDKVIELLITYKSNYQFISLLRAIVNNPEYIYFFISDNEEYDKFFGRIFNLYPHEERLKSAKSVLNHTIYWGDYENYVNFYHLYSRLVTTNSSEYSDKLQLILSEEEHNDIKKSIYDTQDRVYLNSEFIHETFRF